MSWPGFGTNPRRHRRAVEALERAVLRGPRPRPGSCGLAGALASVRGEITKLWGGEPSEIHRSDPRATLHEAALAEAAALVGRIATALAPLEALAGTEQDFSAMAAQKHSEAVVALSTDDAGEVATFSGPDGEDLAEAFADIVEKTGREPFTIAAGDYAELFALAIEDRVVRRPEVPGRRLRIYGPLEASTCRYRSRGDRRRCRGRVAARSANRCVAQPADAPGARPRSAGAAHRACRT